MNGMLWRSSPAFTELEEHVLDWLRQILGLPGDFKGIIYDTASTSTFHGLAAARQAQRLAIESVPVDEAKITSLTQDLTQPEVDVAIQTARLNAAVWGVLTDAQKAEVTKMRAERQSRSGNRRERK